MKVVIGVLVGVVLCGVTWAVGATDWNNNSVIDMQQRQGQFEMYNNQRQQMQEQWMDRYTPNLERPC